MNQNRKYLFVILFFGVSILTMGQHAGEVYSGENPVPFAHVIGWPEGEMAITDENGQFFLRGKLDSLEISCIGFEDSRVFPVQGAFPSTIHLSPKSYALNSFNKEGKELTGAEILKLARKKAKSMQPKGQYRMDGWAEEYSKDGDQFFYAAVGRFVSAKAFGARSQYSIQELFINENEKNDTLWQLYKPGGLDFPYNIREGNPARHYLEQPFIRDVKKLGIEEFSGRDVLELIWTSKDTSAFILYHIQPETYKILHIQHHVWLPSTRRIDKAIASDDFIQWRHMKEEYWYGEYQGMLFVKRHTHEWRTLFFHKKDQPPFLDHTWHIRVNMTMGPDDGTLAQDTLTGEKMYYPTLRMLKNLPRQSWEEKARNDPSPFIQRVLGDLERKDRED